VGGGGGGGPRALSASIQQIHKLDRAAIAGLERFAVSAPFIGQAHSFKLHGFPATKPARRATLEIPAESAGPRRCVKQKYRHRGPAAGCFMAVNAWRPDPLGGVQIATAGFLNESPVADCPRAFLNSSRNTRSGRPGFRPSAGPLACKASEPRYGPALSL